MTAFELGNHVRRATLATITVLTLTPMASQAQTENASDCAVTINTAFAGGNLRVTANEGNTVHVEPDLRGGRPWFYWCFEATSTKPGRVTFVYVQTELDDFLEKSASNPHFKRSVLTKSRNGREVELLQIGTPGPKVKATLVTGRHHANETMASYVLEGFIQEAMSESELAKEFREKYALYAVPFVDKDGVEEGDQGKNRRPHDHNRDYGDKSIYPEIQAIKKLDQEKNFRFSLDFHCPTLVMNDHQVMYFAGPKEHPQYNFQNVSEFAGWIKKGLPKNAPVGPLVWLRPAKTPVPMNSHYFGFKRGTIMAAALEIPFAPPGKATDPASCRKYGQVMLGAWVNTHFLAADEEPPAKAEKPGAPREKAKPVAERQDRFEWLPRQARQFRSPFELVT